MRYLLISQPYYEVERWWLAKIEEYEAKNMYSYAWTHSMTKIKVPPGTKSGILEYDGVVIFTETMPDNNQYPFVVRERGITDLASLPVYHEKEWRMLEAME